MIAKKRGKTKVSVSAKGMKKAVIKITVKNISNKTKTNKVSAPVEKPSVLNSSAPLQTKVPSSDVTSEPNVTDVPDVTQAPKETKEPDQTSTPSDTKTPDVTKEPDKTSSPNITQAPEESNAPENTESPEEPVITKQPDNSAKQTPAVTETPDNTEPNEPQETPKSSPVASIQPSENLSGKNAEDVTELKTIIKLQRNNGAAVSKNLDDKAYTWENGRLVGISFNDVAGGLEGGLDVRGLSALRSLDCSNGNLKLLDASGCENLVSLNVSGNAGLIVC